MDILHIIAGIEAGTLIVLITTAYKVITFFNDIRFKTDLMWKDYDIRIKAGNMYHRHRRDSDPKDLDEGID